MVIWTLILREWGSVQINLASVIRTLPRFLSLFRQSDNSSRDSGEAEIQLFGG